MPTPIADALAAEFNRRLGNKIGAPVLPTPMSLTEGTHAARMRAENRHAAQIYDILVKSRELQRLNQIGKAKFGGGGAATDGLSDETKEIIKAAKESGFTDESKPAPQDALSAVGVSTGPPPGVREAVAKPFMWILDKAARPFYAGAEAQKEFYESGLPNPETGEPGQDYWHSLDDMIGGLWSGFSGKEKTDFGDVVEAMSSYSPNAGQGVRGERVANPFTGVNMYKAIAKADQEANGKNWKNESIIQGANWSKRIIATGENFVLDPLNAGGGKVVARMRTPAEPLAQNASRGSRIAEALGQRGATRNRFIAGGEDFDPAKFERQAFDVSEEAINKRGWLPSFRKNRFGPKGLGVDGKPVWGWTSGSGGVADVIRKTINDVLLEIKGGSMRGRLKGIEHIHQVIAARVSEEVRRFHFGQFDNNLAAYESHLWGPTRLTPAEIATRRAADPIFNSYLDEILKEMNKGRPKTPFATIDDALAYLKNRPTAKWKQWSKNAALAAKEGFDSDFEKISKEILDNLSGSLYNAPGIRFGGRVLPFDRIGRAFEGASRNIVKDSTSLKAFSFGRQFPGRTSQMTTKLAAMGLKSFEDFHAEVKVAADAAQLTEHEALDVSNSILKEYDFPNDPRLQAAKDFVVAKLHEMHLAEVKGGVTARRRARNYFYNYYRGSLRPTQGRTRHIRAYKQDVKAVLDKIGKNKPYLLSPDHLDNAIAKGLNPETDPFRMLLYRKLKSNRLLTKSWFTEDLLDHYGVLSDKLSDVAARARGLEHVSSNLPEHVRAAATGGKKWYLPSDIKQVYQNFSDLASGTHNEGTSSLLKVYDKLLRLFKFSTTIPYPGFHIRNAIGDIFMSHFDGVKFADYKRAYDLMTEGGVRRGARQYAPGGVGRIFIGNRHFTFNELWDMFKKDASASGFFNTDVSKTAETIAQRVDPNRLMAGLRSGSAFREDFFRFSHWLHAFREEFPQAMRHAAPDIAIQTGRDAAIYRVNKYLYDYNALTKAEKEGMRRVIPFYTYTRKTLPALLEGAFLRPDIMSKTQRMFIDPASRRELNDIMPPDYLREIGFSVLPGGSDKEPRVLSAGLLPTDIANRNLNFSSNESFYGNMIEQLAPMLRAPIELKEGKLAFNEQPIKSQPGYLLNSFFPLGGNVAETVDNAAPGRPGNALFEAMGWGSLPKGKSGPEELLSNRIGLGLPVSRITEAQQNAAYYDARQEIYDALKLTNDAIESKGIRIGLSERKDGTSYRVREIDSGRVLFETQDPRAAVQAAQQLASQVR